ncbi:MAG TPA: hypothetical protein VK553_11420, partial [Candidatus Nitrosopolaris rasttigaisensis]|nr:hypothetical protein [Candidatus Nitrosopolaris rasttigaisensis]
MEIVERGSNPYSMFVYAIRSSLTRDYYLRRLRRFFDFINLEKQRTIEERCNLFADRLHFCLNLPELLREPNLDIFTHFVVLV